ncbi:MAG: phospholipid carrier-dependent glycosyltransferase [Alphaproteobacteria bacterium]|jgi:4-amino-4-deoxy-L-arabinose transferase-like glycosyltransferase|nr:phospholipid carrier-dependent glycosyltransferase [Alphaproteobacteria bacterium]
MDLLDRLSRGFTAYIIVFAIAFGAAAPGVFTLPALDRDESRFAQASKQMLETGDYIRIRYQDKLRNKKPAGIHWLQAGSTALLSSAEAKEIWTYRVPNWIGIGLGAMACFWTGIALVGRRAAFVGTSLFASTLLLTSEGHISKTDGTLVFLTTLGIGALARIYMRDARAGTGAVGAGFALDRDAKGLALLFWLAMGLGFLIKGPVSIMVAGFAAAGVWVWDKAGDNHAGGWWRALAWWPGPALFLALWIPWFIWIQVATGGQYVQGAVGKDLADKFTGASEGHAGWPLYQVSHLPVWFFPATLALFAGAAQAWSLLRGDSEAGRRRGSDALLIAGALGGLAALVAWIFGEQTLVAYPFALVLVFGALGFSRGWQERWPSTAPPADADRRAMRFLVAWLGLTWIFFELMPTRLSHYVLPAYPALALICGLAITRMIDGARMPVSRIASIALFLVGVAVLALVSIPGIDEMLMAEAAGDFRTASAGEVMESWQASLDYSRVWWGVGLALGVGAAILALVRRMGLAVTLAIGAAIGFGWHARIAFLPAQEWVQATLQARYALEDVCAVPDPSANPPGCAEAPARVNMVGYAEPSYVMTLGTQNLHSPQTVVNLPAGPGHYPAAFIINLEDRAGPPALDKLTAQASDRGLCVRRSQPRYGLNYSNGDPVHFVALRFDRPPCD